MELMASGIAKLIKGQDSQGNKFAPQPGDGARTVSTIALGVGSWVTAKKIAGRLNLLLILFLVTRRPSPQAPAPLLQCLSTDSTRDVTERTVSFVGKGVRGESPLSPPRHDWPTLSLHSLTQWLVASMPLGVGRQVTAKQIAGRLDLLLILFLVTRRPSPQAPAPLLLCLLTAQEI